MISKDEFNDLFLSLCFYHGKKMNAEMASAWHYRLRFRSTTDLRKALEEAKANHRSMPTLNEVCAYLPRYDGDVPADERPISLTAEEQAINADLWPHFTVFAKDVQAPQRAARLEAFDRWHYTFKGVCLRHRRADLYDEQRWTELRAIHTNPNGAET